MNVPTSSLLDEAHALRLAGNETAALRLALRCADVDPGTPGPIALIARILVDQDKAVRVPEIAARLTDAYVRRGDLPSALVASTLALDTGEDQAPYLTQIAQAFCSGSPRVSNTAPAPPPVPRATLIEPDPTLNELAEEALFERASRVVTTYLAAKDPAPADLKLPSLPLFGALNETLLAGFLSTARVEEISSGNEIVRQGDVGSEAFVIARGVLRVVRREGGDEVVLAQLGPGSMFGEMALISESPRSASVIASEPSQLLVFDRGELERAAEHAKELAQELSEFCQKRMKANLVRQARVLAGLSVEQREQLLQALPLKLFEANDRLITRDQEAQSIYLLASGAVSVSVPEDSDRLVLATLGPGDVVGEISMILRKPASADVIATYPTVAYEIGSEALPELIRSYPPLLVELYLLATRRDEEIRAVSASEVLTADDLVLV